MHRPDGRRRAPRLSPLAAIALAATIVAACSPTGSGPGATATPAAPSAAPASAAAKLAATASPATVESAGTPSLVPIVPVRDFRSTTVAVDRDDLEAALAGTGGYEALEMVASDATGILAALDLEVPAGADLVLASSPQALAKDLAAHRGRLGILRASEVGPGVRALGWGKRSLFGVGRVRDLGTWPLMADLPKDEGAPAFDPADLWTFVAAGDVMLDRGVYLQLVDRGRGPDFPFAGGRARITGRTCCSSFGWALPKTVRTGDAGAVRDLLEGADRSIVNLEGPAPRRATFHAEGTSFSFRQDLLDGLANAGIDIVSLANNHIGDAGKKGIVETVAALDRIGMDHVGAGATAKAARAPEVFSVAGVRVAVLGYDAIAAGYAAGTRTPGSAHLSVHDPAADIRAARRAGADVVIVYPHWGVEYRATPAPSQRTWAHRMIDAGADLVIGNHAHWAAAMEVYKGRPIWYALGNFVFDQTWSEETMEGLVLELTFDGASLVQARMHPTVILDASQPNLLDAKSGRVVLDRVYEGSGRLLPW
ncbi:MAG: CapA family protein [Chloroflexi bacterium]|jgi:poly-gamma-glutamate capsule biosynthesis protein CapA/YwtB (metallophosphatase superfamily)|nr:CapA family protein [Chloroflexota bacterium]